MSASPLILFPATPAELAEAVRSTQHVLAIGAGTKPRLSAVGPEFTHISTAKLSGIVEYEPSEFTFTALAGTPVRDIAAVLAERGQYLPFDPPLLDAGATIGGTVAAGLSGPARFRYGSLRDFIIGIRFVDGTGRLLRGGGKVVKNAAGFDLPKFFVGSLGRFGALAEVTFKVFPRTPVLRTLRLPAADATATATIFTQAASTRWELDALEASPADGAVYARLGGPAEALDVLIAEIFSRWSGEVLSPEAAQRLWHSVQEFAWAHPGPDSELIKVALLPGQIAEFLKCTSALPEARVWLGAGGNVGFVSLPPGSAWRGPWPALTLRGTSVLWPGPRENFEIFRAVKAALDPQGRFPSLD